MKNNKMLNAHRNKKDEFYTLYEDVEKEISHYKDQFKDKIVYCNCDDYHKSNFFKYFKNNFKSLKIKRLVSTSYNKEGHGLSAVYDGDSLSVEELEGDGSFDSDECRALLMISDIVVTNPPFSLFRKYIDLLMDYNKKFIILGNMNAVSYVNIFGYLLKGSLWLGHHSNITLDFQLPDDYEKWQKIVDGKKIVSNPSISWFTNLPIDKLPNALRLTKHYSPDEYVKYDNYDAINVDKVKDIPYDYDGYIGVPITIVGKICSDGLIHFINPDGEDIKYRLLGEGKGNFYKSLPGNPSGMTQKFVDDYHKYHNKTGIFRKGHPQLCYYNKKGNPIEPYTRMIIQKVK